MPLDGRRRWAAPRPAPTCCLTSSCPRRDKTVLVWQLGNAEDGSLGYPKRALRGHSHYVQVRRSGGCRLVLYRLA